MSVTTVPIQPIKKGSLAKYWIGIALILLAAGGLAWWGTSDVREKYAGNDSFLSDVAGEDGVEVTKSGLHFKTIRAGEGPTATDNDVAIIDLEGKFRDGKVFQPKLEAPWPIAQPAIPGFTEALKKMQKGGHYMVWLPPELGYGAEDQTDPQTGQVGIPGNSLLIFEVKMTDLMPREKFEAAMKAQQEAMQKAQGGAGGGQAGAPGGPGGAGGGELPPEIQRQLEEQIRQQGM